MQFGHCMMHSPQMKNYGSENSKIYEDDSAVIKSQLNYIWLHPLKLPI